MVALVFSLATAGGLVVLEGQNCQSCRPYMIEGFSLAGNYTVCIEHDPAYPYQGNQVASLRDGVERYINATFAASDSQIWFTFVEAPKGQCPSHQVTVDVDPLETTAAARAYPTWTGHGAKVRIAPTTIAAGYSDDIWRNLGIHEFLHVLGFDDNYQQGCDVYTQAWGTLQPWNPSQGMLCADAAEFNSLWPANPGGGEYETYQPSSSQPYEDYVCYDFFVNVDNYVWGYPNGPERSMGWVYSHTDTYFVNWDCYPYYL
ncbi:MAG: hypothetical protein M3R55_04170 [Acidobacteriota bacterium]|nr:hypothetical protein [Acidobacteriota bacterium]